MGELEKNEKTGELQEQQVAPPVRRSRPGQRLPDFDGQVTKVTTESEEAVGKIILQSIPSDSQITLVRFEGPNIALYTKNSKFALTELTYYLSSLSKTLKKRFIIRTDPSVRLPEDQTRQTVVKLLPKDVLVSAVFCDDATGEVVLEVSKPETIDPNMIVQIAQSTGWIAHTRRSPHIPSTSINTIHSTLKSSAKERTDFLQKLGKRIFRGSLVVGNVSGNGNGHVAQQQQQAMATEGAASRPQSWSTNKEEVLLFCLGGV